MKFRIGDKVRLATGLGTAGTVENSDHLTNEVRIRWPSGRLTEWMPEHKWEFAEKIGGKS